MGEPRSLDVVQRWFQAVVTHPSGVQGGAASAEAQELIRLNRGELEAVVRRSRNLTAAEQLSAATGPCPAVPRARSRICGTKRRAATFSRHRVPRQVAARHRLAREPP